jgi:hypothetical protein
MGNEMFAKFNSMFDVEGLKNDVASVGSNTGDFVDVPHGDYEVKVVKLELGATGEKSKTPGAPMAKVWFEVLAGEFKGQKIFMNQMLTSAFGIHKMNEFMISLESGIPVVFENFEQYADLMKQVFNAIDGKGEYQLAYTANPKNANFSEYNIVQRF